MSNAEVLQLDGEMIKRNANAHADYARMLERREHSELGPWIASSRLLTAVWRALVDPQSAREELREAAYAYERLKNPYSGVLAVCAQNPGLAKQFIDERKQQNIFAADPNTLLAVLLVEIWTRDENETAKIEGMWKMPADLSIAKRDELRQRVLNTPTGRLGLPFRYYSQAKDMEKVDGVVALLQRAAEPVRVAMMDRYHWNNLYSSVLPLEPEILAACVGLLNYWREEKRSATEFLRRVKDEMQDPIALVPLEVAVKLAG
jgi:hypothetical protein